MTLKPQDVLLLAHLAVNRGPWTYTAIGEALGLSASEAHAAFRRASAAGLIDPHTRRLALASFREFLVHALKYVFPVARGAMTRGLPTAHGASPLKERLRVPAEQPIPVWPDPRGEQRGEAWSPLYRSVPFAARRDPKLYELLVLIDVFRGGRPREREIAEQELSRMLA